MTKIYLFICVLLLTATRVVCVDSTMDGPIPNFQISVDKTVYFVGEPIDITFTLTNNSNETVEGMFPFSFQFNNPHVLFRKDKQEFTKYISLTISPGFVREYGFISEKLKPGKSKVHRERMLYATKPGKLVLSEPGEYELKAQYINLNTGSGKGIESNVVKFIVYDVPESERKAFKQWFDPEMLKLLQGDYKYMDEVSVKAGVIKAISFIETNGNSIYIPSVKKGLADYYDNQKGNIPEEEIQSLKKVLSIE